jgi:Ankyrin repeats (3 copies)
MDWFDYGLAEQSMQEFIKTGHYSFAEYAIVHWAEHLLSAMSSVDVPSLELLAVAIRGFLKAHFSPAASKQAIPKPIEKTIDKYQTYEFHNDLGQAIALLEARKLSNLNKGNVINNLGLEEILSRIRSLMESMSISEGNKESLLKVYGTNIFKCPRIDCKGFFDGFPERDECQQHQKRHDRQFYCTFEGCVAAKSGFTSSRELERHFERLHGFSGTPSFPCYQPPGYSAVEEAIKDANIPVVENFCQKKSNDDGYIRFFSDMRWLWGLAMKHPDDEILSLLIPYTNFSNTNAQRGILLYAVNAKQVDQVRKFVHDRYRRIYTAGEAEWKNAITASISLNNVDMLRILVDKQLSTLNPNGLEWMRHHLVDSCISARLPCVRYLISECGLDPFKHNNLEQNPRKSLTSSQRINFYSMRVAAARQHLSETCNHSALYNAIMAGHQNIVKYLLTFRDDQRFSKPEKWEILLRVAASNGLEEILENLINHKDRVDGSVANDCRVKAKLYNSVRSGKKQLVQEFLPLVESDYDLPDRNGCSMLMYAALNGLEDTVEYLIQKGADVNRFGHCSEAMAKTSRTQTALILATFNGNASIVERLLQYPGIELTGWIRPRSGTKGVSEEQDIFSVAKSKGYENISQLLENHKHKAKAAGSPSQNQDQRGAHNGIEPIKDPLASDIEELENLSDGEFSDLLYE